MEGDQTSSLPYLGGFEGTINPDKWIDYMVMSCLAASISDSPKFVAGVMVLEALMRRKLTQNTAYQDGMKKAEEKIEPTKFKVNDNGAEKRWKEFQMAVEMLALIVEQIESRQLIHIAAGLKPGEGAANHASVKKEKDGVII